MAEMYNNDRIKFLKLVVQKSFIMESKKRLVFTGAKLANKLDISQRTLQTG